jgi:hypothetical protein
MLMFCPLFSFRTTAPVRDRSTIQKYYDLYLNTQLKAKVAAEESEASLTVEQYNVMPRIEVVKKYRSSAGFRRGVDKLIAEGRI